MITLRNRIGNNRNDAKITAIRRERSGALRPIRRTAHRSNTVEGGGDDGGPLCTPRNRSDPSPGQTRGAPRRERVTMEPTAKTKRKLAELEAMYEADPSLRCAHQNNSTV